MGNSEKQKGYGMTRERWEELYGDWPWAYTVDEAVEYEKKGIKYKCWRPSFMELREDGYWYANDEAKEKLNKPWTRDCRISNKTKRWELIPREGE